MMTQDKLRGLVRMMLEHGVSKLKMGELEIEFTHVASIKQEYPIEEDSAPAPKEEPGPDGLTKSQAELLYYSARR